MRVQRPSYIIHINYEMRKKNNYNFQDFQKALHSSWARADSLLRQGSGGSAGVGVESGEQVNWKQKFSDEMGQ